MWIGAVTAPGQAAVTGVQNLTGYIFDGSDQSPFTHQSYLGSFNLLGISGKDCFKLQGKLKFQLYETIVLLATEKIHLPVQALT